MTVWLVSSTGPGSEVALFWDKDAATAYANANGLNVTEARLAQYFTVAVTPVHL